MKGSVFAIHEVYYDENGKIETWTENPVEPCGENSDELKEDLGFYQTALSKPVLWFDAAVNTLVELEMEGLVG